MPKTKVGLVALIVPVLVVIVSITVFAFKYAYSADEKANDATKECGKLEGRVLVNETRIEGLRIDFNRQVTEQKAMSEKIDVKLDKIIERLP